MTANPDTASDIASLLEWYTAAGGPDWELGIALAIAGVIGASVTVYLLLGDFLPAMGGRARITALEVELEDVRRRKQESISRREKLLAEPTPDTDRIRGEEQVTADYAAEVDRLSTTVRSETRRLQAMGIPLYLLLGGVFAAVVADDLLQAAIVGFGWTAVASRLGFRSEQAEAARLSDLEYERLRNAVESVQNSGETAQVNLQDALAEIARLEAVLDGFIEAAADNLAPDA